MILGSIRDKCKQMTITQCTTKQIAIAFALILPGSISDMTRQGTGPAPRANDSTNLHTFDKFVEVYLVIWQSKEGM